MKNASAESSFSKRQERHLLKAAAAAIELDFPNPERAGCPAPNTIRQLAGRKIPLPSTGELVEHIATCSPCFSAYSGYRRQRRLGRVAGPTLIAAIILVAVGLVWRSHTNRDLTHKGKIERISPTPILSATIDYRKSSPTRSANTHTSSRDAPALRKAVVNLTILLPLGSEDGEYTIQIRDSRGNSLITASGVAQWNGTAEVLTSRLDLHQLRSGNYILALRKGEASWRSYPVILKETK